jgi:hypothetical protein
MEQALTAIIQEAWISSVPRRWVEELAQANPLRSCVLHHTIAL